MVIAEVEEPNDDDPTLPHTLAEPLEADDALPESPELACKPVIVVVTATPLGKIEGAASTPLQS